MTSTPGVRASESPTPPKPPASDMTFDQCLVKCGDLTMRTEAECFDACRLAVGDRRRLNIIHSGYLKVGTVT
jgi:hypothetical protein